MWRHPEDHRCPFDTLRTGTEEPAVIVRILYASGLACALAAARTSLGSRSLGGQFFFHISRLGAMQGTKYPHERGKFSSNTVRLTVCRAERLTSGRYQRIDLSIFGY